MSVKFLLWITFKQPKPYIYRKGRPVNLLVIFFSFSVIKFFAFYPFFPFFSSFCVLCCYLLFFAYHYFPVHLRLTGVYYNGVFIGSQTHIRNTFCNKTLRHYAKASAYWYLYALVKSGPTLHKKLTCQSQSLWRNTSKWGEFA